MFDTAPIIYFIEEHKVFGGIVDEIFSQIKSINEIHIFSSVITLTEVLTHPIKKKRGDIAQKYRKFLLYSSNFTIYPIDPLIAEKAAEIRGLYDIKTPDALQLATAIENNGTLFITNDRNLQKFKGIEVMIIEEFI